MSQSSYENIMHGFYVTGYLDRETRRYPVAKNILNTCRRGLSRDDYDKVKANFSRLHKIMLENSGESQMKYSKRLA
ncbi:hypothetical protein ACHAXN_006184 [Cyclotella atomus]